MTKWEVASKQRLCRGFGESSAASNAVCREIAERLLLEYFVQILMLMFAGQLQTY